MVKNNNEHGFVLVAMIMFMAVLLALVSAYFLTSRVELATTRFSRASTSGFAAAEAGLNLRAEDVRAKFVGYNLPSGTSPAATNACVGANTGSGDFACQTFDMGNHQAVTYLTEEPGNPLILTIPPGELYQNLSAQEYRYSVASLAQGPQNDVEAILELRFKSRLVPLFQFAAFYDKDLEILPGQNMTLGGPVHTNGDLYLNSDATLTIQGQVTAAGRLYRGRKNTSACSGTARVYDPASARNLNCSGTSRTQFAQNQLNAWNGMIRIGVDKVTVPSPEEFDPTPGNLYWDRADLRLVLALRATGTPDLTNSALGVEVRNANNSVNTVKTTALANCTGGISGKAVNNSNTFYNNREATLVRMLEVDMRALLNCVRTANLLDNGRLLNDTTEGGLVFHFSVAGPNSSSTSNNYGVRVRNGSQLQSNLAGAPVVVGLSIISDQAFYVHANYNSVGKIPAAFMVDTFNVLSNNWNLADTTSTLSIANRPATTTTVNAAVLSGTDTTGNVEGTGGQGGAYNGGLENYPRFHEDWTGDTFNYLGSFVSLGKPRRQDGAWVYGNPQYSAPTRVWNYDSSFNNAANLPPITPRFVYLRQELFVREYEQ